MFQDLTSRLLGLSIWQGTVLVLGLWLSLHIIYNIYQGIYNVFFHPLRHIPGNQWDIAIPLRIYTRMILGTDAQTVKARHAQYGDIVRTQANVLSFTRPDAWKDIYSAGSDLPRQSIEGVFPPHSVIIAGKVDHARQRKIMGPAFSEKALMEQESIVRTYADLLVKRLKELDGQMTNAFEWYNLTTFDVIGDLVFGRPFGGLERNATNLWINAIRMQVFFIPFFVIIGMTRILGFLVHLVLGSRMRAAWQRRNEEVKAKVEERMTMDDRGDFMDYLIGQMPREELLGNADLLMTAGAHSSSLLLGGLTYYIASTPHAYNKLREEVRAAFEDGNQITFERCEKLPYLQAVLDEALRVFPPVPVALNRKTTSTVEICGQTVPPNTFVGVAHMAAYHSERNFHRAEEFLPERWIEKDDVNTPFHNDVREVLEPFSYGHRNCVGQNLARYEIRLIVAKIFWHFDIEMDLSCRGWHKQRIFAMWEMNPLMIRFTDRLREEKA